MCIDEIPDSECGLRATLGRKDMALGLLEYLKAEGSKTITRMTSQHEPVIPEYLLEKIEEFLKEDDEE